MPLTFRQQLRNRNVWLTLVFTVINSTALGIWSTILSNYLCALTGSLAMVGYSETIQGVTKVTMSFVSGCASDQKRKAGKEQRARVLFISGLLSLLAMGVSIAALFVDRNPSSPSTNTSSRESGSGDCHSGDGEWTPAYVLMVVALCLWGVFAGVYYPAMTAILADSVETGNRTNLYTYRWSMQMVARGLGPLTAALLFHFAYDDKWSLDSLRNVFFAGMVATAVPACLLFFFDDNKTLGERSQAVVKPDVGSGAMQPDEARPLINSERGGRKSSELVHAANMADAPSACGSDTNCCCCGTTWIPWFLAFSDLMFCFGQGMTVKYFYVYFQTIVKLAPSTTMIVSAVATAAAAFFSMTSGRMSKAVGRVQTLIVFRLLGAGTMVVLGMYSHDPSHPDLCYNHTLNRTTNHTHEVYGGSSNVGISGMAAEGDMLGFGPVDTLGSNSETTAAPSTKGPWDLSTWQVCVILLFIAQTGFFNSTQPLMKSILMDYVPKSTRGRWSAVDSLTSFGWSVTTIFGAMIVDTYCYSYLFFATAGCMVLSQLPFWAMLQLVPAREEKNML